MNIAVDIGNRNIKICYRQGTKLAFDVFQSRFTTLEQLDYSTAEVVEYDGVKYSIQQGDYDFEFSKAEKTYLPLLLCAVARVSNDEEVKLMIGSPAEHVLGLRNDLKSQLDGKTFEFKYNNEDRKVTFSKVGVIGEGFATYFTIPKTLRNSIKNLAILDIGGRTTNIATFINGKQDKVCSLNEGILDVKNDILKTMKSKGKDYDINTIENLIDNDRLEIGENLKSDFIKKTLNAMKIYKIDVDMYEWFVTGGGAIDIESKLLDKTFGKNCIVDDALFSNVNGYYNFMVSKWGE